MKTVSVVIPCYNSEATIERALRSVYEQTYSIHEIICVDDCSTDSTIMIVSSLFPQVKIIKKNKNSGPAVSRNMGIKFSTGQYIAFLDSDDFWLPQKTEVQMKFIQDMYLDCIGSSFSVGIPKREFLHYSVKMESIRSLLFRNKFPTPSVIIRNDGDYFSEDMKYSEDYDLWLRLAENNKRLAYVIEPLVCLGKDSYGESGLSANLFKMECGELKAITRNTKNKFFYFFLFHFLSFFKFLRRLIKIYIFKKLLKYKSD
ncbi:glycosyltransferase family 2 protein [Pectobacterium parmentieri]|uniref:glycosyltransferase family 2 protein n=1 Tax=Pectobacterium parmentieri TaxID=1905730 RepID=UPI0004740568|nr:glycosyltransferase family A protein [Pectobacterium parmentieri]AYH06443.1 glycosyltransferase family 2 protein [Pectobacterium parmentieri]AYH23960.1 glycosyltransferase family 2 protein [Pectobacterium parmentieri]MBN3176814.1 glycosyltransferase family 2 protein [Pectobacterium parmentieri]